MTKLSALLLLIPAMSSAANYTAQKVQVDGIEVVRLADAARQTEVSIVPSIGNQAYEMKVKGKNLFWFPFASLAEFRKKPVFCANPFLAPWANRFDHDSYYANGKRYRINFDLENVQRDPNRNPIHGLLAYSPLWQVTAMKAGDEGAEVTSRLEFWRYPDLMAQFPIAHNIEMTYRLREGVLEVETHLENLSAEPMPVAVGYHPYFQVHDLPREDWKVHVAARDELVLTKIATPTGQRKPVTLPDPVTVREGKLDTVFDGLIRGQDGRAEFWVQGKEQKLSVIYGPKYTVAIVYAPTGGQFICFEPMAAITNAFNMEHAGLYPDLQSIAPGGHWRESFWIKASGW